MQVKPAVPPIGPQVILVAMESIHARIKRLRMAKGMSLETFAEKVGIKWQSVQQWEKEDHEGGTAPSRKRQAQVAAILGVSLNELMSGNQTGSEVVRADAVRPIIASIRQKLEQLEMLLGPTVTDRRLEANGFVKLNPDGISGTGHSTDDPVSKPLRQAAREEVEQVVSETKQRRK